LVRAGAAVDFFLEGVERRFAACQCRADLFALAGRKPVARDYPRQPALDLFVVLADLLGLFVAEVLAPAFVFDLGVKLGLAFLDDFGVLLCREVAKGVGEAL